MRPSTSLGTPVAVQLSALGLYLPPVFKLQLRPHPIPPHTITSVPVQTAVCSTRAVGALAVLVAVQLSSAGLYLPPVLKKSVLSPPPQTIISLPVHTAVCASRAMGALIVLVAVHVSVAGSYLPPVLK